MKRILSVAGSDSGGGAGIQADIKTITVLGGYAMSALTALTAQNTVGVQAVHPVPVGFLRAQLDSVLGDIGADAVKTGMLATAEVVDTVAEVLARYRPAVLVVDPVMVAKSGDRLLDEAARVRLREVLVPMATVVTPNLPEAAELCGFAVRDPQAMERAAAHIHALGARAVLVKGGHLDGPALDILFDGACYRRFAGPRLARRSTHGTGCTYSAALATCLARGLELPAAVAAAKTFVSRAIATGLDIGRGHGPTNHHAGIAVLEAREPVLARLDEALRRLLAEPLGRLIPEVRSNLAYALPGALEPAEVAAIPGRISEHRGHLLVARGPAFGASSHVARVVLAAMRHDPEMRSAMNLRLAPGALAACQRAGLRAAGFERSAEPAEIKRREGATLEWGTDAALERAGAMLDVVYDHGEPGKEPMLRVLGRDPDEVVDKVLRIAAAWTGGPASEGLS